VCYSAQIRASYKYYVREWGADISIKEFVRLYWMRNQGAKIKIPKAMEAAFAEPETDDERQIKATFDPFETRLAQTSRVQLTLDDGTVETIEAPVADGFRGFISDLPIRSLDILTLDLDDEGNNTWALLDELFVGTPR